MRLAFPVLVFMALAVPLAQAAGAQGQAQAPPTPQRNAPSAEQVRLQVRKAVEAHRAQERDDIRRQEAEVGRRLTAAERAELREQVRYQWLLPGKTAGAAKVEGPLNGPPPAGPSPAPGTPPVTP